VWENKSTLVSFPPSIFGCGSMLGTNARLHFHIALAPSSRPGCPSQLLFLALITDTRKDGDTGLAAETSGLHDQL